MPIAEVSTDHVSAVLRPIWLEKPETASRVRGRIEKILAAAKARGFRPIDAGNPAQWRGHLDVLLPKPSKLTRGHHAALPWRDAPAFMALLRERPANAAGALEFTILTAARSGETLGATWSEIDFDEKVWIVPAHRTKAGVQHVVPLSDRALNVLNGVRPAKHRAGDPLFNVGGVARSNMAMAMLLRRMGRGDLTTHGFRSTFRDWAGDGTDFPRDLIEQALAHTIGDKAERAYRRGTAIERRRILMEGWSNFLLEKFIGPATNSAMWEA
jgi:integrase